MAVSRPFEESDLGRFKGVGPSVIARLSRLGIIQVSDLLFHLPIRYEDRTRIRPLGGLRAYEPSLVDGCVELAEQLQRGRRSFVARIADGTGGLTLRFFHYTRHQRRKLVRGARVRCFGEVRPGPSGLEMVHPEYEVLDAEAPVPAAERLTPVYPVTEGISQGRMRALVEQALAHAHRHGVVDLLPMAVRREWGLVPLLEALETLHRPRPGEDLATLLEGRHPARLRLILEELAAHQLGLRRIRAISRRQRAPVRQEW
jgi:ATP-dependent DNA helicase RecG